MASRLYDTSFVWFASFDAKKVTRQFIPGAIHCQLLLPTATAPPRAAVLLIIRNAVCFCLGLDLSRRI